MSENSPYTGKDIALALDHRLSPDGRAKNSTNAFVPLRDKMKKLMAYSGTKFQILCGQLAAEIESERNRP